MVTFVRTQFVPVPQLGGLQSEKIDASRAKPGASRAKREAPVPKRVPPVPACAKRAKNVLALTKCDF